MVVSPIDRYYLQLSTDNGATWTTWGYPPTTTPLVTSWTWAGLSTNTSYMFRVFAHNSVGFSAWSAASAAVSTLSHGTSAPRSVAGVAGNGRVALTWQAPVSNGGSPITGYGVDYSSDGGSTWTTALAPSAAMTATSYPVTGLTNGTPYVFRVVAANTNGTGPWSATSAAYTPHTTVPGAPTGVTGSNATSSSIDVSWTPPADDGGVADRSGTTLQASRPITVRRGRRGATRPRQRRWSRRGPGLVWRRTRPTCSGSSPITRLGSVLGQRPRRPSVRLRPRPLGAAERGGCRRATGEVALTWQAPASNGGSPITGYGVDYSSDGGSTWTTALAPSAAMTATSYPVTGSDQRDAVRVPGRGSQHQRHRSLVGDQRRLHAAHDGAGCADGCDRVECDVDVD